jgi:hypothetical protein
MTNYRNNERTSRFLGDDAQLTNRVMNNVEHYLRKTIAGGTYTGRTNAVGALHQGRF